MPINLYQTKWKITPWVRQAFHAAIDAAELDHVDVPLPGPYLRQPVRVHLRLPGGWADLELYEDEPIATRDLGGLEP